MVRKFKVSLKQAEQHRQITKATLLTLGLLVGEVITGCFAYASYLPQSTGACL
jgi:hypothetical protein